jgi:predicted nuclease of predicted toxin-antitoxin system
VKLLVDMNLSPLWIRRLADHGIDAVHWSSIGEPSDADEVVLSWARTRGCIVLTHDLDFSAILAATAEASPSVVQLRMHDLLSEEAVKSVVSAVNTYADAIASGALLSIDERGARVRILPLRRRRT